MKHASKNNLLTCEVTECASQTNTMYCAACCVKLCAAHQEDHPCKEWRKENFQPLKGGTDIVSGADFGEFNSESMPPRRTW
jgi:hypothetical protein